MTTDNKIHWWEDSGGRKTMHKNGEALNFEESFLGEIARFGSSWKVKSINDSDWHESFRTSFEAMKFLESMFNATPVNHWD